VGPAIIEGVNGLGHLVREVRERHGLDRDLLALRAGVPIATIAATEQEPGPTDSDLIETLLLVLGQRLIADPDGAPACEPLPVPVDPADLESFAQLSMAERLERSLGWNRFASELAAAALRPAPR
jgi:DNA-binding XRE family transcriptional regulator